MRKLYFALFLCIMVSGCKTVKRYKSVAYENKMINVPTVKMALFSAKETKSDSGDESKTLWDLKGEGQNALISKLSERFKDNDDFKKELNNSYLDESESKTLDFTTKDIKIILSISKHRDYSNLSSLNGFSLADRIEFLKFSLALDDTSIGTFEKWNKFETEFAEIEIEDISFGHTLEATLGGGGDATIVKGEVKGGMTKTEEQKLKYRYARLNGKLNPDKLEIEEEGTREIDLTGNVIIDATIKFKRTSGFYAEFDGLKDKDEKYQIADSIKIIFRKFLMPHIGEGKNLTATLTYNYVYRNVINRRGAKTFIESDDKVKYFEGKDSVEKITLLNAEELKPIRYAITLDAVPINISSGFQYSAAGDGSKDKIYELLFDSEEKANKFCAWLKDCAQNYPKKEDIIHFGDIKLFLATDKSTPLSFKLAAGAKLSVEKITPQF